MFSPHLRKNLLAAALVLLSSLAAADVVTEWNEKAAMCINEATAFRRHSHHGHHARRHVRRGQLH